MRKYVNNQNGRETLLPKFAVEWAALMFHIWNIPGSSLGLGTDHPD
jgi:hypothetical protein